MKIGRSISILGEQYQIRRVKGLIATEKLEGYMDPHKFLICVDASLKGRVLERTFLHEVAHAYAMESGLHEILTGQSLEQFCQTLSALIVSLK